MTRVDERILEHIQEELATSPRYASESLDLSQNYAGERLRLLAAHGLVDQLTRGLYRRNDVGRRYLRGDLDASTLSPSTNDDSS